jgi:hypothetical protein
MLLQHLKEQLLGGYAEQLRDEVADLDKAQKQLRELYDSRDLQVSLEVEMLGIAPTASSGRCIRENCYCLCCVNALAELLSEVSTGCSSLAGCVASLHWRRCQRFAHIL